MAASQRRVFWTLWLALACWLPGTGRAQADDLSGPPLYALLVGGGPDVESNAAQIEGHVRFVAGLLRPSSKRILLFADGKADHPTVSYADTRASADAQRALAILLADHDTVEPVLTRPPELDVPLDGPARLRDFHRGLATLSAQVAKRPAPLLLYFAGHGTQDEKDETNTRYDLWDNDELNVRVLSTELARLPRGVPVVLVMAQCFSGAFADVLFPGGDSKPGAAPVNVAGFFSAQKDQEAAGCSYATERADYQDFSSYFFGALCGQDRFGDKVAGADYDGNGAVSLHEAFCYALIHDRSSDTPVCTSDVYLRSRASLPDATIFGTPYQEAREAGTPAQRAVLEALSQQLGLEGESRALTVFDRLTYGDPAARPALLKAETEAKERLNALRQRMLGPLFERWPALRWADTEAGGYKQAFTGAVAELAQDGEKRQALLEAGSASEQAGGAVDNEEAALRRFASLYEHLVEARHLREHGQADAKARFERLWQAEQGTLPLGTARGGKDH